MSPLDKLARTCVIVQPTFMPWIGWFDLVDQADVLIILDDVQFSKQSWQQRNRVRTPEGLGFLTVPVKVSGRSHQAINEVELANKASVEKLLRSIQACYARAPFFRAHFAAFSVAMREGAASGMLADLNIAVLQWIMEVLGIAVPTFRASELNVTGKRGEYVAALCERVAATHYLSPAGAEEYLQEDRSAFDRRSIAVSLHVYEHPQYRQCFKPFLPFASVLDLIFNEGPNALAILRSGRGAPRALGVAAPAGHDAPSPRRFAFRVDASAEIGIGHLMRCQTLAVRLARRGGQIFFISRALPNVYLQSLLARGFEVHLLPPPSGTTHPVAGSAPHATWLGSPWEEDAAQTAAVMETIGALDVLVIDHYAIDQRWEAALRSKARLICVIDDLADRPHDCDVLLDADYHLPHLAAARYRGLLPPHCRTLLGPGYALLRDEFFEPGKAMRPRDGNIRHVLIFYGGADQPNLSRRTLEALAPFFGPDLQADVVIGAINPNVEDLRALCAKLPNVRLHVQATNMAELMAAADLAFGACGTTAWERCAMGLPAVVVVLADNQRSSTNALAEAGVVESLGEAADVTTGELALAFGRLVADPARCRAMSVAARAIMHIGGASIDEVLAGELPFEFGDIWLRYASHADAEGVLEWCNEPVVRMNPLDPKPIHRNEHLGWAADMIERSDRHMLIGFRRGNPVGMLRLDEKGDDTAEVSICLPTGADSEADGDALLRAHEAWVLATLPAIKLLVAFVTKDNLRSHRLFEKRGYVWTSDRYQKRITQ